MDNKQQPSHGKKHSDIMRKIDEQHRREVWLQITLPCLLFLILLLAAGTVVVSSAKANAGLWANISIILLIIPLSIFMLTISILLAMIVFGVTKMMDWLPHPAEYVHNFLKIMARHTRRYCDYTVAPIMRVNGWKAATGSVRRAAAKAFTQAAYSTTPKQSIR